MLRTFLTGIVILAGAILFNGVIARLGIIGWYEFLNGLSEKGTTFFRGLSLIDHAWLFFIYPLLLGLCAVLADKIWTGIFQ